MSVDKKYISGDIPTSIIRGNLDAGKKFTQTTGIKASVQESQKTVASIRDSESPLDKMIDGFLAAKETTPETAPARNKRQINQQIDNNALREMTTKEHEAANNKAQTLVVFLMKQVFPEGLDFFSRPQKLAENPKDARGIAQDDFNRIKEDPSKILEVAINVVPGKLMEGKKLAKEAGNKDEEKRLDRVDEILGQLFGVMAQVEGKGSHQALLGLIDSLDPTQIKGELHTLITDYHKSLASLGKQIQRSAAQMLDRKRHPFSELITGVSTVVDKGLQRTLYTRPESLGAAQRDHLGGIMGSIYDFKDTDWKFASMPWEYGLNVKGEDINQVGSLTRPSFPVRRLAMQMTGYVGQLTEEQPGPMFTTTDVDARFS
jgi:hypothetical protein